MDLKIYPFGNCLVVLRRLYFLVLSSNFFYRESKLRIPDRLRQRVYYTFSCIQISYSTRRFGGHWWQFNEVVFYERRRQKNLSLPSNTTTIFILLPLAFCKWKLIKHSAGALLVFKLSRLYSFTLWNLFNCPMLCQVICYIVYDVPSYRQFLLLRRVDVLPTALLPSSPHNLVETIVFWKLILDSFLRGRYDCASRWRSRFFKVKRGAPSLLHTHRFQHGAICLPGCTSSLAQQDGCSAESGLLRFSLN